MRGTVLVGVWGAGKTSVYQRAATKLVADGCQSLITMPQAATITMHTYTSGDTEQHVRGVRSWLESLTGFLEDLDRRFHASTLPTHRFAGSWAPTCLLETLAFDAPVYELPLRRAAALGIEHRLAALGLYLVFLRVPDDQIRAQCVESTRAHRSCRWADYLARFGRNDAARAEHIRGAQSRLERWVRTSPMPTRVINTGALDWDTYASQVEELITSSSPARPNRRRPSAPTAPTDPGSQPA